MPGSLTLPLSRLCGFLLVLARVSGAFVFVPLPGGSNSPGPVRALLALGCTLALSSRWPSVADPGLNLAGWIAAEATFGIAVGLAVSFIGEAFLLAAQTMGLQAGYAYASTVDPTTQADASVLLVFAQLAAGLLFFSFGLDREVLRIFAASLDRWPAGGFVPDRRSGEAIVRLASGVFSSGLRLALPAVGLLLRVDIALALLGRLNAQLQLLTLAFPVKMLAVLCLLAAMTALFPQFYRHMAAGGLAAARALAGY